MQTTRKSIVLIGMMGAGKSSVGRLLQRRTGLDRFDTDELVSAKLGISIEEIFLMHGEDEFRMAEAEALRGLVEQNPAIVVTGGGVVLRQENVQLLKRLGIVVWLDGNETTLFSRATRRGGRPLLQTEDPRTRFTEIFKARAPLYERAADVRIDTTDRTHDDIADLILDEIEKRSGIET